MAGPTNPLAPPVHVAFTKTVTTSQRGVGDTSAVINDPAWLQFNQGMSASVQQLIADDITTQAAIASLETIAVVGAMVPCVALPGSDWHNCDGAPISRTTYSVLFGIIGTTFGAGDGSTTFNVPTCTAPGGATGAFFAIRII